MRILKKKFQSILPGMFSLHNARRSLSVYRVLSAYSIYTESINRSDRKAGKTRCWPLKVHESIAATTARLNLSCGLNRI